MITVAVLVWQTVPKALAIESTPAHVGGVLTACAGDQISLTCSHDNLNSGVTSWLFYQPVDCTEVIDHAPPISTDPCGPFTFQDVSILAPDAVLSSTAVATANTSMTSTVVECRDSAGILYDQVGNISLCILSKYFDTSVHFIDCLELLIPR